MNSNKALNWIRVNNHNPCPVCGKPDWCLISRIGQTAICARIESSRPAGDKGAGWLHNLDISIPITQPATRLKQTPTAPPKILDTAYRALLSQLELSKLHRDNLHRRGLTDDQIAHSDYKTLPAKDHGHLIDNLMLQGVGLAGVPGFYLEDSKWKIIKTDGLLIPVKDFKRRIVGIQIRCDEHQSGKYKWLSSRGLNKGCSPGTPIHVAGNQQATKGAEIWITEGPLKANIAAFKLNSTVLAVPGVGNWKGIKCVIDILRSKKAIVAFDMDKHNNHIVQFHCQQLTEYLLKQGIRTFVADWDPIYKGLDDILTAGSRI